MMLPILISVSLAPGSYFFWAWAAPAVTRAAMANRTVIRAGIVLSPSGLIFFQVSQAAGGVASVGLPGSARLWRGSGTRYDLDHPAPIVIGRVGFRLVIGLPRGAADQRWLCQQTLGQRNRIGGILVPQRGGETRAGEISRHHPPGMAQYLRARRHAVLDGLQHQLHVETGLLGDRKALGEPGNLDRAHQIVDQLVHRAGADGAE